MKNTISLVLAAVLSTACLHTNTKLPGVLDLRSDGSGAQPATDQLKPSEETSRAGFGSFISGEGLQQKGADITIEDRQWFLLGLIHIVNDQGDAEYKALPKDTVLRNVKVGDALTGTDILVEIVPSVVLSALIITYPLAVIYNWFPHFTINVSGTRISGAGGGGTEPPPPTGDGTMPPSTDPNAPSTTTPPGT